MPELDVLRGFLLVWMTCTHLPTRLSAYSNQTFGYISAAEGFIFLAAFLTGQVQRRAENRHGPSAALRTLFRRLFRIYRYHLALLIIAFTAGAAVAVYLDRAPMKNLLDFYLARPGPAAAAAAILIYNPPLFDILPIYILFTLLTPLLLWAARKRGWTAVLAASVGVWLLAQFQFREWLYAAAQARGFPVPVNEAGAFDLFAWQFLWVLGLALGTCAFGRRCSGARIPRVWLVLSVLCAAGLFVCRHSAVNPLLSQGVPAILVNKWKLGVVRLVDLAALGVLLVTWGKPLGRLKWTVPLAPLGRASLEVFSVHVLFCVGILALSREADPRFTWWQDIVIVMAALATLFAVAHRTTKRRPLRFTAS